MNPAMIAMLLSGGSSTLGALFNRDPYQQILKQIGAWSAPGRITADTNTLFHNWKAGPAFGAAQTMNMEAANQLRNQMAGRLGSMGISSGGVGQTAMGLASSSYGPLMSQLMASGWSDASQAAQNLARMRLGALGAAGTPQNIGGSFLGGGIAGLGDILKWYLEKNK